MLPRERHDFSAFKVLREFFAFPKREDAFYTLWYNNKVLYNDNNEHCDMTFPLQMLLFIAKFFIYLSKLCFQERCLLMGNIHIQLLFCSVRNLKFVLFLEASMQKYHFSFKAWRPSDTTKGWTCATFKLPGQSHPLLLQHTTFPFIAN